MNRRYLILFILGFTFFVFLFKTPIITFINFLKINFQEIQDNISNKIEFLKHQSITIEKLKKENINLRKKISSLNAFIYNCQDFQKLIKDSNLTFTKTISYAALPDFSQIYITYKAKNELPKGLVYNNLAAGIVIKKVGNYSLAILNSNEKTSYSVYIIDNNNLIPGIFYGKVNLIKYIPKFKHIKKGDLVITSGLDGVFYKGAKVGIIENVKQTNLYQEAKIKLFYNSLSPNYFYVIDKYHRIKR